MGEYDARTYGRIWAEDYDRIFPGADPAQIDLLATLAGHPPRALELAIGTGRVALPLGERGVEVSGIDISEEMVAKLKEKPGGEGIQVVMGDFADVDIDGRFPLIYLAFNTLFGLLSQERQITCFENVAAHLERGGRFVIDCFVPDMARFDKFNTRAGVFTQFGVTRTRVDGAPAGLPAGREHNCAVQGRCRLQAPGLDSLCLAFRARSDGPARRSRPRGAVGVV